jgi:flagellar FliJ protein
MPFRFRLQSVLEHRAHLEEKALHEFARGLKVQKECEQHIAWLEAEALRARQELEEVQVKGMPASEFQILNEYATVLRLQALRERARLPMLVAQTEAARARLMEARRDRMVLETLRERHLARWQRRELKREQAQIDEAAIGRYLRRESS